MGSVDDNPWLAGIDGCLGGWIVAFVRIRGDAARVRIVSRFVDILCAPEAPAVIAIDVPIGLPEQGGRIAEVLARKHLGKLKRSVFSIPSRQAVYSELGPFANESERYAAHQRACAVAEATSNPPKRMTIQTFGILPKIREVDEALRAIPAAAARVCEVHPELAFWRLNGDRALNQPKKVKSRPHAPGLALRRRLLVDGGLPKDCVNTEAPRPAGPDDLLDALACAAIARRIHAGEARPFPYPPPRDAYGLAMAIWA
jgi:predicted RNase H-like nuclease